MPQGFAQCASLLAIHAQGNSYRPASQKQWTFFFQENSKLRGVPEVRVAAHHVTAALHVLSAVIGLSHDYSSAVHGGTSVTCVSVIPEMTAHELIPCW